VRNRPLLDAEVDADPLRQFEAWFAEAAAAGIRAPEAMALATAVAGGAPSVRMVLLKRFDMHGFVFHTNHASRKGRELAENPRAALLFHWDTLGRQVRIEGPLERTSRGESEEYFRTRPRGAQIAAWASRQSEPISSRDELDADVRRVELRFRDADVPLPPDWGGFRLVPERYEFWQHRDDRLHDRLVYEPEREGRWRLLRLAP
jgi:pyridoxamine 5'-phosphate oxidase